MRAQTQTHTQTQAQAQAQAHNGSARLTFAAEDAHENAVLGRRPVAPHGEAAAARGGPHAKCGNAAAGSGGAAALDHKR